MTHVRSIAALVVAAALALSACGSSSGGAGSATGSKAGGASVTSPVAAPVALSGQVNDHGTKDLSGDGDHPTLAMELDDDFFSPTFVQATPGATISVVLRNNGAMAHTFTLDDKSVDTKVLPGKEAKVTVTIPKSGSLRFLCDFHVRAGMQGAFYTASGAARPATPTTAAAQGSQGY